MNKFTAIFLILNSIILINCQTTTTTTTRDSTTTTQSQTTTTPKIVTTTPKLTTTTGDSGKLFYSLIFKIF